MRYRLRTLLIVLALGPPLLAGAWWLLTNAIGWWMLLFLAVGLFAFGTGFVIAWMIIGINVLIARLQGRR